MKILFTIDTLASGGKERMLVELMKGLKDRPGIDFQVVTMSNNIHFKEIIDLGITIHKVIRKTKKDITATYKLYKICKSYKPDLIHCWDTMTPVLLIPTLKLLNIKLVNGMVTDAPANTGIFHTSWVRARLTFPFSKVIIGNCQAGLKAYNAPKEKSVCIPNGFDFDRMNNVVTSGNVKEELGVNTKYVIGMVATYSKFKDYATYFAAATILLQKRNDVTFLAIGRDTDSDEAKSLIEEKYLNKIKLLGAKTKVERFISIMDVCVLATFTEGISNSIMEYMALGKPVIATDGGGTKEILEDEKTGFLVSVSNPVELAQKMELLLNNDELRMQMGEAGKARVKNNFTLDRMVNEFVASYEKILH